MRRITDLRKISGACISILACKAELRKLCVITFLCRIHELLKNKVFDGICRHIFIKRFRIDGKLLAGNTAVCYQFIHQIVNGLHNAEAEACDQVPHFAGYRHHFCRAESLAVHYQRFHDFRHGFAFFAVKKRLLLCGEFHFTSGHFFENPLFLYFLPYYYHFYPILLDPE